jgi:hypothetical protein
MTTIATDGVTIAADGRTALGSQVVDDAEHKIVVDRQRRIIFALSGAGAVLPRIMDWHRAGAPPESAPKPADAEITWSLIVIENGPVWPKITLYTSKCAFPSVVSTRCFAIGSGGDYAIGAMCAGKTPEEAVRIVIENKLDVWTGGEVQVVNIAEALGQIREAAE